jgi:hypothetical protein
MSRGPRVLLAVLALVPWAGHRLVLATDRPPNEIVMATWGTDTPSYALGRALSERWAESTGLTVHVAPAAGDSTPTGLVTQELADLALTPGPVPAEELVAPVLVLTSSAGSTDRGTPSDGTPEEGSPPQELWAAEGLDPRVVAQVVDDLTVSGGDGALELEFAPPTDPARSPHPGAAGMAALEGGLEGFWGRHGGAAVSVVLLLALALTSRRAPRGD